jgi:ketosteroid isomerase-like protein
MHFSRRNLFAAGTGLATWEIARAATPAGEGAGQETKVAELIRLSGEANAALMKGDIKTYTSLVQVSEDFTLMSPFGGKPSQGTYTPEQWEKIGRFFRNGNFSQEVVRAYGSSDMAVLAIIERTNVEVGGLPAQDWALRVTLAYRRNGSGWQLVHRHADPLVHGISLQQAAAFGRGDTKNWN